jgi:hypothetical protein
MTRPRLIIGLAIPLALAIAIVLVLFTHHDGTSPPPTTVAAASTTRPTTQPPQDQWLTIIRQIVAERHALFENPRPEALKDIYHPNCSCFKQDQRTLADLQRRGLHYDDQGTTVQSAKLVGRARDATTPVVAVEVISQQLPQVLVNSSGNVVERIPKSSPTRTVFQLIRGSDHRWRVFQVFRLPS